MIRMYQSVGPVLKFVTIVFTFVCSLDGSSARELSQPTANASVGRHLTQSGGPQAAGCAAAGLSCCYNPNWWLDQQPSAGASCTSGTYDSSVTPEFLIQACIDGSIGQYTYCSQNFCQTIELASVSCDYYENLGDYTGSQPCSSNNFNGQDIQVYDPSELKGNNDEVLWADATVSNGQPTGVQTCNSPGASYTLTATYSKSSSWNIGIQLGAKFLTAYEAKLTAGYSETYTSGQNAGVTVSTQQGQHATVTAGTLVHHTIGWWDVKLNNPYKGCSHYRVDNVAADLIMPTSDPNFPTDLGVDVKPCGYPLLNGKLT
ncbi:hypothetical protein ABBQ38_010725 [Trebouxia sp. C0009 RCD-2024]